MSTTTSRNASLQDVAKLKVATGIERMDGVIVTGDVAFSGKKSEYDSAAQWLDQLTQVIGCAEDQRASSCPETTT